MNKELTPESRAAYKIFFDKCDEDGDGRLDFKEVHDMFVKIYGCMPSGFSLRDAFDGFDKDGNNKIDYDEFLQIAPELPPIESLFYEEFKKQDNDKNGLLTARELRFAMMTMGHFLKSETAAQDLIDSVDTDNDGKLNVDEFVKLLPRIYQK